MSGKIKPLSFEQMKKLTFKERSDVLDRAMVAQLNENALRHADQPRPKPKKKRR